MNQIGLRGNVEGSLLRPIPVAWISGIAEIQICAFWLGFVHLDFFFSSLIPFSGTKHTKDDCIGPLELFVTFRYIYAILLLIFLDHPLVVELH